MAPPAALHDTADRAFNPPGGPPGLGLWLSDHREPSQDSDESSRARAALFAVGPDYNARVAAMCTLPRRAVLRRRVRPGVVEGSSRQTTERPAILQREKTHLDENPRC